MSHLNATGLLLLVVGVSDGGGRGSCVGDFMTVGIGVRGHQHWTP